MTPPVNGLTHRENDVVELLSLGHGVREIAQRLQLTDRQVTRLRDKAREKKGASTQAHLVRLWMESGNGR